MNKYFCPSCHREIPIPEWLTTNTIEGGITLGCGNCKNGKITITVDTETKEVKKYEKNQKQEPKL